MNNIAKTKRGRPTVRKTVPVNPEADIASAQPEADIKPAKATTAKKVKRIPFRKQKRIGIEKKPGMTSRLVNDKGNRIDSFLKAGYTLRENSSIRNGDKDAADASQFGNVASQIIDSQGNKGYYMDIPTELLEEDLKAKEKETLDLLKEMGMKNDLGTMRRGKIKVTVANNTEVDDQFKNTPDEE
jgi:hypothetical protein